MSVGKFTGVTRPKMFRRSSKWFWSPNVIIFLLRYQTLVDPGGISRVQVANRHERGFLKVCLELKKQKFQVVISTCSGWTCRPILKHSCVPLSGICPVLVPLRVAADYSKIVWNGVIEKVSTVAIISSLSCGIILFKSRWPRVSH